VTGTLTQYEQNRQKGLDAALKDGLPTQQLVSLMEDVKEWVVSTAPNLEPVGNSEYAMVFIVGGTRNSSESLNQNEVNTVTRKLFSDLQSYGQMTDNFIFLDRSDDFTSNIDAYTGDVRENVDPLGRGGGLPGITEYRPEHILLLKLEFGELRDLNNKPEHIDFTLSPIIEWGGNRGERLAQTSFEKSLEYSSTWLGSYVGQKGKWMPIE
jgi:hypothetical protein